jgi:hypothetical protein
MAFRPDADAQLGFRRGYDGHLKVPVELDVVFKPKNARTASQQATSDGALRRTALQLSLVG